MVANFYRDLAKGKEAERLVLNTLSNLTKEYIFEDVSYDRSCYHKGDIKAIPIHGGEPFFIEVKNDSRIAATRNVLCEEATWYDEISDWVDGNMYSDYQIYAVVSCSENKIYIMDFSVIKEIYKKEGKFTIIPHKDQLNHCYLLPLDKIVAAGGMIAEIEAAAH